MTMLQEPDQQYRVARVVKVTWRDSHRYTYQMPQAEEVKIAKIRTLGFLISEDEKQVVLAQELIGDDMRGVIAIPKENIYFLNDL